MLGAGRPRAARPATRGPTASDASGLEAGAGTDGGATTGADGGADAGADGGIPLPVEPPAQVDGLDNVRAIAAGSAFTCALLPGGDVRCWGDNSLGQLGSSAVATGGYSAAPVTVSSIDSAASLAAGVGPLPLAGQPAAVGHSCALLEGGSVGCWGQDDAGQLGDAAHPVQGATAIAAGARHSCAVVDGGVVCWGDNSDGQLGAADGSPVPPLGGAVDVAAGGNETCVLRDDGSVSCWGSLDPTCKGGCGQAPAPVALAGSATQLAVGPAAACAVLDDSSVECWDRTGVARFVNGVSGVKSLDVGAGFACAVLADASVVCWGENSLGQLGDGTTTPHPGQLVQVAL